MSHPPPTDPPPTVPTSSVTAPDSAPARAFDLGLAVTDLLFTVT